MSRDEQKIKQVEDKLDGSQPSHAFMMQVSATRDKEGNVKTESESWRVGGPDPSLPLKELERNLEIARARWVYAVEQKDIWESKISSRYQEFNDALIVYTKEKYKLTDKDLEGKWSQDVHGVFVYKERVSE